MKKTFVRIATLATVAFPLAAFAALENFNDFLDTLTGIINRLIPFLIAVATLVFIFGVVRYITAAGDEGKVAEGRKYILWGVLGLAVIVVVWGLVNLIISTLGLNTTIPTGGFPSFPT